VVRESDLQTALTKVRDLSQPLGGHPGWSWPAYARDFQPGWRSHPDHHDGARDPRARGQAVEQAVQIIERRINEAGPGRAADSAPRHRPHPRSGASLGDPKRLIDLVGKTAKLDFRMVDETMTAEQALASRPPPESEILYGPRPRKGASPYVIEKRILVSGADLTDAQPGFDPRTSEPVVNFRFNSAGARKFAAATAENVGKRFAAVLDNEVITAPVIREPILQGSGQISGSFTVESANDLAILLRAGALPAR